MRMNPEEAYRLAIVSSAPVESTRQAKEKGRWLMEVADQIEKDCKAREQADTPDPDKPAD